MYRLVEFQVKMQQFLSSIKGIHPSFYNYFSTHYCKRVEEWAVCHRKWKKINTNMVVEAFHRVLKRVYLEGKQNRRIDHLMNKLLIIAKDAAFGRFIKLNKGKSTHRITEINRRHKTAEIMKKDGFNLQQNETNWTIWSQNSICSQTYTLEQGKSFCDCKLKCSHCDACTHMYTCTCMDSIVHTTVCKHMHLLHMELSSTSTTTTEIDSPQDDGCSYFSNILRNNESSSSSESTLKLQQKRKGELNELMTLVSAIDDPNALMELGKHLNAALNMVKAIQQHPQVVLQVAQQIAPNKNSKVQKRFFFNKKETNGSDSNG